MTTKQMSSLIGALIFTLSACEGQRADSPAAPSPAGERASDPATSEGSPPSPALRIEASPLTVSFHPQPAKAGRAQVAVAYQRSPGDVRARAAELYLRVGAGLTYQSVSAGLAVLEAGKELIVQPARDGLLRVVIFSRAALSPLEDGPLFILNFEVQPSGPQQLELLRERPLFAPSEANHALHLPEALSLNGAW